MYEGLLAYLGTLPGVPAPAEGLFISRMPENPPTAAVLMETGGLSPMRIQESDGFGIQRVNFQIVARGADYPTAQGLAEALARGCAAISNEQLGDEFWLNLLPQHPPVYNGPDMMERPVFFVNLAGMMRDDP